MVGTHDLVLLFTLLFVVPLPYLNPLTFPLMTLYLGAFTTIRMIYQLPIIKTSDFNLTSNCSILVSATTRLHCQHVSRRLSLSKTFFQGPAMQYINAE